MNFYDKYFQITKKNNSFVCLGLDTDLHKIPSFLQKETFPSLIFNKRIIDETYQYVAAYKPNFAFYLAQGLPGIECLKATLEYIPPDIPTIIDLKAGDIGNTMEQYAEGVFGYFHADAMTINPLMGIEVIKSCLTKDNSFAFALALTSNESASDFFYHQNLYLKISSMINRVGEHKLGAVVGATHSESLKLLRQQMPKNIFLVPGIGVQGGDLAQVCQLAASSGEEPRLIINISRGIIYADQTFSFAKIAQQKTIELRSEINHYLSELS